MQLQPGARVLHVGGGLGNFTVLMAHCVGPTWSVVGVEVDETLAASSRPNLSLGRGSTQRRRFGVDAMVDAVLVNVGFTHPPAHAQSLQ